MEKCNCAFLANTCTGVKRSIFAKNKGWNSAFLATTWEILDLSLVYCRKFSFTPKHHVFQNFNQSRDKYLPLFYFKLLAKTIFKQMKKYIHFKILVEKSVVSKYEQVLTHFFTCIINSNKMDRTKVFCNKKLENWLEIIYTFIESKR